MSYVKKVVWNELKAQDEIFYKGGSARVISVHENAALLGILGRDSPSFISRDKVEEHCTVRRGRSTVVKCGCGRTEEDVRDLPQHVFETQIQEYDPAKPNPGMKLYRIVFDNDPDYVEASNLANAVVIWKAHLLTKNNNDPDLVDVEPESIELAHDEPVLR